MTATCIPVGAAGQSPSVPQSVFITGANGFLGRALLRRYQQAGCDVRGMDLHADPEANVVAGDLTEPDTWRAHA